jgi:hypothetical protein
MGQSTPLNKHSSIPRVLCPRCGTMMRLAEVDSDHDQERLRFDCACAFEYRMSRTAQDERRTTQ